MDTKIKILVLAANPVNMAHLRLDEEIRSIQTELKQAKYRDRFELVSQGAVRVEDLSGALLDHKPQIVHFAGHGQGSLTSIGSPSLANSADDQRKATLVSTTSASEGLMFVDSQGKATLVSNDALAGLFKEFQEYVKCVVLNACYSETLAKAIHQYINCVVGMNHAIGDQAAIKFATGFYKTLMAGEHFERAYNLARNGLDLANIPESLTPMLHYRILLDDPFELKTFTPDSGSLVTEPVSKVKSQSNTEYGEPVSQGLNALTDLMQTPKVRDSVHKFRTVFGITCEQINVVADYKGLHDVLHTLEFQCYNGIVEGSKRFPDDETTLDILMEHNLTLQNLRGEIQKIVVRETIATHEVKWLSDLEKAQAELHGAIEELDIRRLQRTIWLLNKVLANQLSRINTNLTRAAQSLQLPALVDAMTIIAEKLSSTNLDQEKLRQFQEGVEVLAALNQKLATMIARHDNLQALDLELRRIEANLDQNSGELEMSWPDLQTQSQELFGAESDQWASDFQQDIKNLDMALETQNPSKIKRYFRLYRRRVSNRFFEVDVDLKRLCEELREVGEPLTSVLRMI